MITVTGVQQDMMTAEKRRRRRGRQDQDADGGAPGATAAHAAAEAELDAAERESAASKATGAEPGPGTFREPARPPEPQDYRRGYLDEGHAAPSPQAAPPNAAPLPPHGRGILTPAELPSAPLVAGHAGPMTTTLAAHQAKAQLRPPVPPGRPQ